MTNRKASLTAELVSCVQNSVIAQADLNDAIQEMIDYMGEPGHRIVEVMAFTPGRSMMHSLTSELMASMMLAKTVDNEDVFQDAVSQLCGSSQPRGIGIRYLDEVVVQYVSAAIRKDNEELAVIDSAVDGFVLGKRMEYIKSCILSNAAEPACHSSRAPSR